MGMGIRATLVLLSVCSVCLCCRPKVACNMVIGRSTSVSSEYDRVDIYYEKGAAPWDYYRQFLVDAPAFLKDKKNWVFYAPQIYLLFNLSRMRLRRVLFRKINIPWMHSWLHCFSGRIRPIHYRLRLFRILDMNLMRNAMRTRNSIM